MAVQVLPLSNSGEVNLHLHAVCENKQCSVHQRAVHMDCVAMCNGRRIARYIATENNIRFIEIAVVGTLALPAVRRDWLHSP
jgi:hypothetical protein